ncbi:FCS-Like Zinc finger 3 [Spinacia oleracea]|uniref:FCS-Like Zinc finger 3 n=1 Tax=Spinacia oleracea TaxID=3562 RepID=A0A9R0JDX9_SPIOL|nr:FCS-Like Zinc finger 3 [Spinacia oleracea]
MASFAKQRSSNSRVSFYAGSEDFYNHQQPHFLDSCFLCNKQLKPNHDIFMYRGNTPFCSDECRQDQIEIDEAKERPCRNLRTLRKTDTPTKSGSKRTVRTGTVSVA